MTTLALNFNKYVDQYVFVSGGETKRFYTRVALAEFYELKRVVTTCVSPYPKIYSCSLKRTWFDFVSGYEYTGDDDFAMDWMDSLEAYAAYLYIIKGNKTLPYPWSFKDADHEMAVRLYAFKNSFTDVLSENTGICNTYIFNMD